MLVRMRKHRQKYISSVLEKRYGVVEVKGTKDRIASVPTPGAW